MKVTGEHIHDDGKMLPEQVQNNIKSNNVTANDLQKWKNKVLAMGKDGLL